ncbi:fasciclin-3 isoform X4 [Cydia pomonella]|uniref:fasciclin-3 isoform X4 n=1 Tax=Cydia pomonella TaxID=82600 RepID=UPI002ADDD59D|nr:fasciclin-3 isoform X4 [Cydia pomonella]
MAAFPAFLLLFVAVVSGQIQITPREAVRQVGESLDVLCKVNYPISFCRVEIGRESYTIPSNSPAPGDPTYYGKGLQEGECGAHITNIKEAWNGDVYCSVPQQIGSREIKQSMKLIVARPPGNPELIVSPQQNELKEGETIRAICRVPRGRPAANITWHLGEEEILNGLKPPVITNSSEPGLEDVTQELNKVLTADDDQKQLACRVSHLGLNRPLEARRQLDVQYPPRRADGSSDEQITIFGLKIQEDGRLNVTVRSNPEPTVEWKVSDVTLLPGHPNSHPNENSVWTALHPLRLPQDETPGSGYYNITLVLSPVTSEDVERNYFLTLSNKHGEKRLMVKLSTLEQPAAQASILRLNVYGMELEAGAIVGIVVGILILLLAVFLVVFAKATDRWCFAGGRGRDHTKNSGESSDTESAVGGRPSRLASLGARVRSVLPRGKDKVQATEPQADKPLAEDKKGVVYAELALGEQTSDKPQPPSTEYAEIVYTEQPKETKETKE